MRSLDEILETSLERPAFSNGDLWDIWSYHWCNLCIKDSDEDCPLILAGFMNVTPREWVKVGLQDYECTEFEPREEEPTDV